MEKHLIVLRSKFLWREKQILNDPPKEAKSEPEMRFFWTVIIGVPLVVA